MNIKFLYTLFYIFIFCKNKSENFFYDKFKNNLNADNLTFFKFNRLYKKNLTFRLEININYYPICLNQPKYNSILERYIIRIGYLKHEIGIIGGREILSFLHFENFLKYPFIDLYLIGCNNKKCYYLQILNQKIFMKIQKKK